MCRIEPQRTGGYLAGPGSVIAGRRYEIAADLPIAGLPDWLGDLLVPVSGATSPDEQALTSADPAHVTRQHER